jgi:pimeloyl-ACP methyl ester carboxylesterase
MATFVLIHGAFRGGWCWREVRRLLQASGHEAFAPDLTGAGARAHLNHENVSLSDWRNDVANLLRYEDLRDVVLVGHSMGGVIITAASEVCAERLGKLVFLDAPVPENGQAAVDLIPEAARRQFGEAPRTGLTAPWPVSASEGIDEVTAAWINERLTPVPAAPSFEPITLTNPAALALPRVYVFCEKTPPFFPASFTRQKFDQKGVAYRLLPTGHDCMLSAPALVAELLRELLTGSQPS